MQYRTFGKDKRKVSVLGFGCMRLPTDDGTMDGKVDEKESSRIIRYGIDHGINYVDTAKVYLNGKCEAILGRILQNGYREKVSIATKLPVWDVETIKDADRIFDEQRRDLKTEKIDIYLLHNLQRSFDSKIKKLKLAEWGMKKKEKGEIDYIGFSYHDDSQYFTELVDSFNWDFCQLQYNYTGENTQAGTKGVKYAAEKGLSLIIMEPLLGGALARPTGNMRKLFASDKGKKYVPADLGLRWLWNQPEITVVLSGMSAFDQVEQNIQTAEKGIVGNLSAEESAFVKELQQAYDKSMPIKCTKCRYCMPCPNGVDIPHLFDVYNNHVVGIDLNPNTFLFKIMYANMPKEQRADNCARCGQCEEHCPQKLPIQDNMVKIHQTLS